MLSAGETVRNEPSQRHVTLPDALLASLFHTRASPSFSALSTYPVDARHHQRRVLLGELRDRGVVEGGEAASTAQAATVATPSKVAARRAHAAIRLRVGQVVFMLCKLAAGEGSGYWTLVKAAAFASTSHRCLSGDVARAIIFPWKLPPRLNASP